MVAVSLSEDSTELPSTRKSTPASWRASVHSSTLFRYASCWMTRIEQDAAVPDAPSLALMPEAMTLVFGWCVLQKSLMRFTKAMPGLLLLVKPLSSLGPCCSCSCQHCAKQQAKTAHSCWPLQQAHPWVPDGARILLVPPAQGVSAPAEGQGVAHANCFTSLRACRCWAVSTKRQPGLLPQPAQSCNRTQQALSALTQDNTELSKVHASPVDQDEVAGDALLL